MADDIDSALDEFDITKDYNPYHKNIDKKIEDLKEIRNLRKKNEELDEELRNDPKQDQFFD